MNADDHMERYPDQWYIGGQPKPDTEAERLFMKKRPCGLITGCGNGCPIERYLICHNDDCGYQNHMGDRHEE